MQTTIKKKVISALRQNNLLDAILLLGKIADRNIPLTHYKKIVLDLAASAKKIPPTQEKNPLLQAEQINRVLYDEFGLQGKEKAKNVIDDPHRFFLHTVLERKTGNVFVISTLYHILAEQVGLRSEPYTFLNQILLKIQDPVTSFYVDPYDRGRFLSEEDFQKRFRSTMNRNRILSSSLYEKLSHRAIVGKLTQQIKQLYLLKNHPLLALQAVDILTELFPESAELRRDRGILYCEMEYFSKARKDLNQYVQQRPNATDVNEIRKLTSMLRGYREIVN